MDCKEIEKIIPLFVENKLDAKSARKFVNHIETCKECKEELTIQFLVSEGMSRLEEGSAFDLQKELNAKLEMADNNMTAHRLLVYLGITMEVVAFVALGVIIFLLMM